MGTGKEVDFNNGGEKFTIELDTSGNLNFLANETQNRRMSILDSANEVSVDGSVTVGGTVTIGGSGQSGDLQLRASDGDNTIFLGSSDTAANVVLGGNERAGEIQVKDGRGEAAMTMDAAAGVLSLLKSGLTRITLDASLGEVTVGGTGQFGGVQLKASDGDNTIFLGSSDAEANILLGGGGRGGHLELFNAAHQIAFEVRPTGMTVGGEGQNSGITVQDGNGQPAMTVDSFSGVLTMLRAGQARITLDSTLGRISVGSADKDGRIELWDGAGEVSIRLSGDTGLIECDTLEETGAAARTEREPVRDALAKVLALRPVHYRTSDQDGRETTRVGLVGAEVAQVCPELTETVARGRVGVNYSRLAAVLVEAVKQQQQLIEQQAARLADLQDRLDSNAEGRAA